VKEKELRLALVCYGGVSLAVYMHGVTKEILKLVRASRDRHSQDTTNTSTDRSDVRDTEDVYAALLSAFEPHLDLRVVVDIISGASAGGINGVILGRALAHDLDLDPVQAFWLRHTDVVELMNDKVQARWWNKILFRPFVWALMFWFRKVLSDDKEFRKKLSIFLRSRWFKPPFDGARLTEVLFDGLSAMGEPLRKGRSLLPDGLPLNLFVTVTDFFGYTKETPIHDPASVIEREHRQVIQMRYRQWPKGVEASDFDQDNISALAFACRATSSFPGAFPPAQLGECDRLLQKKGQVWKGRVDFLYANFAPYLKRSLNPAEAAFVDGSVLVNKPFAQAIGAISGRPAYRQIDRRVLYIDPHPRGPRNDEWGNVPGFFRTLKGALSDIPRNEPIHEDLAWVNAFNDEVHRLQTVVEASRPHINAIVSAVAGPALEGALDGATISRLRLAANAEAKRQTGFAYEGYLRLKLTSVIEDVGEALSGLCGQGAETVSGKRITTALQNWATKAGVSAKTAPFGEPQDTTSQPTWVRFLLRFDARFRQRRLRFAIRTVNQLYPRLNEPAFSDLSTSDLDQLKRGLYDTLDLMAPLVEASQTLEIKTVDQIKRLVTTACTQTDDASFEDMDAAMSLYGDALKYEAHAEKAEETLAALLQDFPIAAKQEILEPYIGFAAWDVLTFSITNWRDLDEFNEIRVVRVSPDDATSLRPGGTQACLKGQLFNHFGAFFSRAYRENDYLWGRLHAAERLIDIVVNAAGLEGAGEQIDVRKIKSDAFVAILETEAQKLPMCATLITELRRAATVL